MQTEAFEKVKMLRATVAAVLFPMLRTMSDGELIAASEAVAEVIDAIDDRCSGVSGFFEGAAAVLEIEQSRRAAEIMEVATDETGNSNLCD